MNMFYRKFREYTTYQSNKEFSSEGGINITQKFSSGSPCNSGDDISDLGSLRSAEMTGTCNTEVTWQHLNIRSQVDALRWEYSQRALSHRGNREGN